MLKPSMQELLNKVENRYLLVNLAAQRARDISDIREENGESSDEKSVKLALDEIADGSIVYRSGPRVEAELPKYVIPELAGTFGLVLDDDELLDNDSEGDILDEEDETSFEKEDE